MLGAAHSSQLEGVLRSPRTNVDVDNEWCLSLTARTAQTVATLRRYIRSGEIFRENAAKGLGSEQECARGSETVRPELSSASARENSLPGHWRASCQAQDLQPSFKMGASALAGSVGMSDFFAAHDWHTLGKYSHELPIRLPLFCRETLIQPDQGH